ncbi:unnamed protein product [Ambrosiozyma monospora]|uniref:Unnamed protein product n=1 Tax=Ambrosiozyma monospora TaxID=43982 RepID=A0ACB5U7W6_AMBMO|nr:unnamed protein product [Ambrosiozyma monospora]
MQFRKAELESLARLHNIDVDFSHHKEDSPFLVVQLENDQQAINLVKRGILIKAVYELWGQGEDLPTLHKTVQKTMSTYFEENGDKQNLLTDTFKFELLTFLGGNKTPLKQQLELFDSFKYLPFKGRVRLKNPQQTYSILQNYEFNQETQAPESDPNYWYMGRLVCLSLRSRGVLEKLEISKRPFYGTTTFDTELSLVTFWCHWIWK